MPSACSGPWFPGMRARGHVRGRRGPGTPGPGAGLVPWHPESAATRELGQASDARCLWFHGPSDARCLRNPAIHGVPGILGPPQAWDLPYPGDPGPEGSTVSQAAWDLGNPGARRTLEPRDPSVFGIRPSIPGVRVPGKREYLWDSGLLWPRRLPGARDCWCPCISGTRARPGPRHVGTPAPRAFDPAIRDPDPRQSLDPQCPRHPRSPAPRPRQPGTRGRPRIHGVPGTRHVPGA